MADDAPRMALPRRRLIVVTAGLLLSMMLSALDTSIVATAMPRIIADLSGLDYYAWVTTAYLVTTTTIIPISGKLGDLFGRKRFVQSGMLGFVVASALCGMAQSMPQLVAARALQGVFGGFLTSSAMASMADLYLPATRVKMQGVFLSVLAFAAVGGPIVGGILTDQFGWRYVFYVNLPVGLCASAVVALSMPNIPSHATWRNIDVRGSLLLASGLIPLLSALSASRASGWSSPLVSGLLILAGAMLGAFVLVERGATHPVMPLVLFKTPTFTVGVLVSFLTAFGMFGSNIYVPLVYQGVLGLSATQSGVLLTPRMIGMVAASLVSGQTVSRIDRYRFVSAAGLVTLAGGLFLLSQVTSASSELEVIRDLVLIGVGFGSNQPIYQSAVMSAVPYAYVGVASSQVQFWRSLGQTIGVTILGTVLASQLGADVSNPESIVGANGVGRDALATALQSVFLVAAVAVAVAVVVALLLKEVPMRGAARRVAPSVAGAEPAVMGD